MAARNVTVTVAMRNKLSTPAKKAAGDLNALARAAQLSGHHFGVASDRYDKFTGRLSSGRSTLTDTSRATTNLVRTTRDSSRALNRQSRSFRGTSASAEASRVAMRRFRAANTITGVSRGLDRFRRKAVSAFGAPVSAALEFGKGIAEASTLTDEATFSTAKMESITLGMSKKFGGQAKGQVKALYDTISAGFGDAAQATDVLTSANKLAVGGVTDVATAGDGLTTILNAYHLSADRSGEVTDTFFATVKAGKTTVPELSRSLGKVAPIAASLGIEFSELGGSIAALTAQGLSTAESVTGIRASLSNIQKPSKAARIEARRLGVDFSAAGLQAAGGLGGLLKQIQSSRKFNRNSLVKLFGSIRAVGAVTALGSKNFAGLDKAMETLNAREGSTTAAFNRINSTDFQNLKRAEANMEALKIELGKGVTPALVDMARVLNKEIIPNVSAFLRENKGLIKATVPVGLALIGVSAVLSPLLLTLSSGITIMAAYGKASSLAAAGSATLGTKTGVLAGKFAGRLGMVGLALGAGIAVGLLIDKYTDASGKTADWLSNLTGVNAELARLDARERKPLAGSRAEQLANARSDLASATKNRKDTEEKASSIWFGGLVGPALDEAKHAERRARDHVRLLESNKGQRRENLEADRVQLESNLSASARGGASELQVVIRDDRIQIVAPDGSVQSVPLSDSLALAGAR